MVTKRRILYIEHKANISGGSLLLLQLLDKLDRKKYEPYVVCPTLPHSQFATKLEELNIPYFVIFLSWWTKKKDGPISNDFAIF